jgi:hypothetical protein
MAYRGREVSWPFKRIRILDEALVVFAGRPGFDTKVIVKQIKKDYHYTISIRHGANPFFQSRIPIDIHKTFEGAKKQYESIGRGSFDMRSLVGTIAHDARPDIREIDVHAREWRNREVMNFDERLISLLKTKELRVTADFAEWFSPVPVSHLRATEFGIGMMTDDKVPGMLVKAADRVYALGLPGVKGLEERLEEAIEFESFVDEWEDDEEVDEDEE